MRHSTIIKICISLHDPGSTFVTGTSHKRIDAYKKLVIHSLNLLFFLLINRDTLYTRIKVASGLVVCGEYRFTTIDHFTVVCSVTCPLNDSEAGGDLALIQTSLLLLYKST